MLHSKDVRTWPLDDRRKQLRDPCTQLSDSLVGNLRLPLSELMRAVREHQLEGIVAKCGDSPYRSAERSSDWVKGQANRGQEFVIGGYMPSDNILDSLLFGYYEGRHLLYAAAVRAGIPSEFLASPLVPHLEELRDRPICGADGAKA